MNLLIMGWTWKSRNAPSKLTIQKIYFMKRAGMGRTAGVLTKLNRSEAESASQREYYQLPPSPQLSRWNLKGGTR